MVKSIVLIFICLLLLPCCLATLYYLALAAVRIGLGSRGERHPRNRPRSTFAIVIPAHNEESGISQTLRDCLALKYPRSMLDIWVIADNCSDATDVRVAEAGVHCLIRVDPHKVGKGYALEWALETLVREPWDALLVLDADCRIDPDALMMFNEYLCRGHVVLQASYLVGNVDASPVTYALAVGNKLENDFFYSPKSALRMSVFLRGTGMVLRRDILERFPWTAHCITEDVEYSLKLLRAGIRVTFVPEVQVTSAFPVGRNQLRVQRTRWAEGTIGIGKVNALQLIWEGIRRRRYLIADAGITLMLISRPLVLCSSIAVLLMTTAMRHVYEGMEFVFLFWTALCICALLAAYLVMGVFAVGLTIRRFLFLLRSPLILAKLSRFSIEAAFAKARNKWVRTPR